MRLSCLLRLAVLALPVLTPTYAVAQVTSYAFVPNANDSTVSVIDTRAGVVDGLPIPVGAAPIGAVSTPDGRRVYVTNTHDDSVTVIDVATRMPIGAPIPVGLLPQGVAVARTEGRIYVANLGSDTVSVIDVATDTVTATIPVGDEPIGIAVTPGGSWALVTNHASNTVSVIDLSTNTVVGSIAVGAGPLYVSFRPDGQRAYVSNVAADTVSVIDVPGQTVIATIPVGTSPFGSAVTPDGSTLFVANASSNTVSIIDAATNTVSTTVPVGVTPQGVAVTPNGRTVYVANTDSNSVSLIDVPSRTVIATIAVGDHPFPVSAFVGPNILTTTCPGCGPLPIASDADLTALGFRDYVSFNTGGLLLTGTWSTDRRVSLLSGGGTIHTNGFDATVNADVIGEGTLTKDGAGWLVLTICLHTGGTYLRQGVLSVWEHPAPMHVRGGTLSGVYALLGTIDATSGVINPGGDEPGIMSAEQVTLTPAVTFVAKINGTEEGQEYDRLDVSGTATLGGATLSVQLGYTPAPGDAFTILTHASGTFAGLPEGAAFTVAGTSFRITYHGGTGSDVVLVADSAPTLSTIGNQTVVAGHAFDPIAFTIADDLTAPSALVVTATSSNATLLPNADLVLGGSGASRTLTATPVPGASGTTTVTITVSDGWLTTQRTFTLTMLPVPVYYLAEGATGGFYSTDLLLANPNTSAAPVDLTFFTDDGTTVVQTVTLPAMTRRTIRVNEIAGLEVTSFSTAVASTTGVPLVVERTMWWDASGYGAHTEKASAAASSQWYFAEGSQGFFHTYFLLLNPHAVDTVAHVTYFLEDGPSVQRQYTVPATSRRTIDAGADPALVDRSFGALIAFDLPGMAERAMYFGTTPLFSGGHGAAGVTVPSRTWFLAEGATGTYFDTFVLLANPTDADANVTLTYLPDSGVPIVKAHPLAAHQRLTINIATEDPALASAAVATQVEANQPVIAERSVYWPRSAWYEGHNSAGETAPGTRWGLAEGRVGGSNQAQTYILIANPGTVAADITATFLRVDGTPVVKRFTVAPTSRFNIAIIGAGGNVPELADESFAAIIDATQPIIVERSLYTDAGGVTWAAGTNATATRLP
jgi:YVTN family beta-propeller protein